MTKETAYKKAVDNLRSKYAQDVEAIYLAQKSIVLSYEAEDKDKNNAAKNCLMILGVGRVAPEKPPEKPTPPPAIRKDLVEPELSPELEERLKNL